MSRLIIIYDACKIPLCSSLAHTVFSFLVLQFTCASASTFDIFVTFYPTFNIPSCLISINKKLITGLSEFEITNNCS